MFLWQQQKKKNTGSEVDSRQDGQVLIMSRVAVVQI